MVRVCVILRTFGAWPWTRRYTGVLFHESRKNLGAQTHLCSKGTIDIYQYQAVVNVVLESTARIVVPRRIAIVTAAIPVTVLLGTCHYVPLGTL
jgi:hypothetical protein